MLNYTDKVLVSSILDGILGIGTSTKTKKGDERKHYCPFCNHHKQKLQINLDTQAWNCWVCESHGGKIQSLLKRLHADTSDLKKIYEVYKDEYIIHSKSDEGDAQIYLPREFTSLTKKPPSINPLYSNCLHYLKKRGFGKDDIIKYNIGFCESGKYKGRIIIPSYNSDNRLNYFIARLPYDEGMTYENPAISRNVIIFENQINWNEPITLCEGAFDGMSIKRNVIPLLGKFIPKKLMDAIFTNKVTDITIILDDDAQDQALYYSMYFQNQGIRVRNIKPDGKDPNKLGFSKVNQMIKNSKETKYEDIIAGKLNNL
jgi:transcription elongation factor Elf1